jgi:uncharacterized protein (DUF488 family)
VTPPFFTIGHSSRSLEAFTALLREADVALVADVRKMPRSRTNPQFNRQTLPGALAAFRISYEHMPALGGLRGRIRDMPPGINGLWTNRSFHNYADYALTGAFQAGFEHLLDEGRRRRCAVMCSEAVWWRCHRRIIADYLIARGRSVFHIMGNGRMQPARLTPGAIVRPDGTVAYPAGREPNEPEMPSETA